MPAQAGNLETGCRGSFAERPDTAATSVYSCMGAAAWLIYVETAMDCMLILWTWFKRWLASSDVDGVIMEYVMLERSVS